MTKKKIYISSTFRDLESVRKTIIDRIQAGLTEHFEIARIMEIMHGDSQNRSNQEICIHEVSDADLYILILGSRYGSHPDIITHRDREPRPNEGGLSYTELEYDAACEVMQNKFYGIYKFVLTDKFFTPEELAKNSDLDDPLKKQKHDAFQAKLGKADTPIKIDSILQLEKEINDKLTEFQLESMVKLDLGLTNADYNSIDRTQQLKLIKEERNRLIHDPGVYAILVGLEDKEDCPHEFTLKVNHELTESVPEGQKRDYIDANSISSITNNNDPDKVVLSILAKSYKFIRTQVAERATFEMLAADLKNDRNIQNVFIGFEVYAKTDLVSGKANFLETIAKFIQRVNQVVIDTGFGYNFYFLIYIYGETPAIAPEYRDLFKNVKCIVVDKLPRVVADDAKEWITGIHDRSESPNVRRKDVNSLFRMIFLDPKNFPIKYKRCLELVKNRTK